MKKILECPVCHKPSTVDAYYYRGGIVKMTRQIAGKIECPHCENRFSFTDELTGLLPEERASIE